MSVTDTLDRFKTAQDDPHYGFATALAELEAGRKRSHWIWYIFPQLAGLGMSPMAVTYGLRDIDEAVAYLHDPALRARLMAVSAAVAAHVARTPARRLSDVMGSDIDARKLVSSMTLFGELARRLHTTEPCGDFAALAADADTILREAEREGIPACVFTRQRLREG